MAFFPCNNGQYITKLWEDPNPTGTPSYPRTINYDANDYDGIIVWVIGANLAQYWDTYDQYGVYIPFNGSFKSKVPFGITSGSTSFCRNITAVSKTYITFSADGQNPWYAVPLAIYGVKFDIPRVTVN